MDTGITERIELDGREVTLAFLGRGMALRFRSCARGGKDALHVPQQVSFSLKQLSHRSHRTLPERFACVLQVHSSTLVQARVGQRPEADALFTQESGLALAVVTADCVPVLLLSDSFVAAVHAGWRGIASRILEATVTRLAPEPAAVGAIIGPSIGPCCYEVGQGVADQVAAASDTSIITVPRGKTKPHLDLYHAARTQLERAGIRNIQTHASCTQCAKNEHGEPLWCSYRRDGKNAGRNLAMIWS